jgi:hypothetical protein
MRMALPHYTLWLWVSYVLELQVAGRFVSEQKSSFILVYTRQKRFRQRWTGINSDWECFS